MIGFWGLTQGRNADAALASLSVLARRSSSMLETQRAVRGFAGYHPPLAASRRHRPAAVPDYLPANGVLSKNISSHFRKRLNVLPHWR